MRPITEFRLHTFPRSQHYTISLSPPRPVELPLVERHGVRREPLVWVILLKLARLVQSFGNEEDATMYPAEHGQLSELSALVESPDNHVINGKQIVKLISRDYR